MAEISPENCGPWTIHGGNHCGVRIDGPNGRAVLHVIQRDAHPTTGQGITQAESEAIAKRVVELWNAAIVTRPVTSLVTSAAASPIPPTDSTEKSNG